MKKIFFLIYIFLNFSFAYSENIELKSREDVEIENIESQIKVLENKIQTIKKLKNEFVSATSELGVKYNSLNGISKLKLLANPEVKPEDVLGDKYPYVNEITIQVRLFGYLKKQESMAEKMNKAIELAKAQSSVEITDNSRNTMVRYDNKGKQQGWIAHAGLTLESKDSQALSTLVNELDGVLAIAQVNASVSREKLSSLENELTKEALAKLKDKAVLIQESLQMKGYRIQNLEISSANDSVADFRPYAAAELSSKSLYSSEKDETYTQSGKEKIKVSVNARIALLKE